MLGVNVLCAPTDEEAHVPRRARARLAILRLRQGRPDVYPTPEEAAEYAYTPMEREVVRGWTANHVVGDSGDRCAPAWRSSSPAPAPTS